MVLKCPHLVGRLQTSRVKYWAAHVAVSSPGSWSVTGAAASSVSPISNQLLQRASNDRTRATSFGR